MPRSPEQPWYARAADLVVREGKTLSQAVSALGVGGITLEDATAIFQSVGFQRVLRAAHNRYYLELVNDPEYGKALLAGKMLHLADKLIEEGEKQDAADVLFKLAKLEGWASGDSNINLIGSISQKDIELAKSELARATAAPVPDAPLN